MNEREADFRRLYQELRIANQREFYQQRSQEYDRARQQSIAVRNVLLVLAAVAGVVGQFFGGDGRTAAGIVAASCAALATAVTAYESLIGFGALAKLYRDAARSLRQAELNWDGGGTDLAAAVEQVEQICRSEQGYWGQLTVQNRPALPEAE